ncbi:MAG: SusE domain-containing protein [Ginsengibacter sp.]|jgi:hypothetical protein
MKKIFKIVIAGFLLLGLGSCKKVDNQVILKGGTAPVLSSALTGKIPLSYDNRNNPSFTISWTNPNYQFNTGANSQDVNYNVLIDTTTDFSNPELKTVSVGTNLSKTFLQSEFNDILVNQLMLATGVSHKINIRLDAFLNGGNALLSSNTLSFTAIPYAPPPKIAPPSSGTLFIVGSATPGGWNNPMSVDPATQQFTQLSPTLYSITIKLTGGGEYKLIAVNGSWDNQWSIAKQDDPDAIYGGDFIFNGANILSPPATGNYKIDVDFQRGKFTVTKL